MLDADLLLAGRLRQAHLADRQGRRRVLLWSMTALPLLCLLTSLAPDPSSFALVQIGVSAFGGLLLSLVAVMIAEEISDGERAAGQAWFGFYGMLGGRAPAHPGHRPRGRSRGSRRWRSSPVGAR